MIIDKQTKNWWVYFWYYEVILQISIEINRSIKLNEYKRLICYWTDFWRINRVKKILKRSLVLLPNNTVQKRKYNLALYFFTCLSDIWWKCLSWLTCPGLQVKWFFYPCSINEFLFQTKNLTFWYINLINNVNEWYPRYMEWQAYCWEVSLLSRTIEVKRSMRIYMWSPCDTHVLRIIQFVGQNIWNVGALHGTALCQSVS